MFPNRTSPGRARALGLAAGLAVLLAAAPDKADAQIRASEPASVSQTIDGTKIDIEYFRPKARGRSPLFGHEAVVWEHIWTPGANWSTNIAFEKPIKIEGVDVEPGKYSIWMVMSEADFVPEEIILHPNPKIFHTNPPELEEAVLRLPVTMEEAPHTEMLTWDFEDVRTDGATLALRWGGHRMAFDVAVEPTMRSVATEEEVAPILGTYEVTWRDADGETAPFRFIVTHADDGTVHGDLVDFPGDGDEAEWLNNLDMMLLPMGDRIFGIGEGWDGKLTEVWPGAMIEFEMTDGPSTTLQFRGEDDSIWGGGERSG